MADKHKSHPQAPLYGPGGASSTGILTQLKQYEGALSIGWSQLTSVPTTISGYGITDAYTQSQVDTLLLGKANVGDSYTKAEADALLAAKANSATTLAGYGITDAYTKTATDALLAAIDYPVDSVFGRTGAVVAAIGDYDASKINPGTFPTGSYQINGTLTVNDGRLVFTGNTGSNVPFYINQAVIGGGSNFAYGMLVEPLSDSGVTSLYNGIAVLCHTAPAVYTVSEVRNLRIFDAAKGAGSTITTQYGLQIDALTAGATNYAIFTNAGIVHFGDRVEVPASVAANAPFRIPHGSAPTSPVNGDMWTTTAGLFIRINGATVGPLS